MVLRHTPPDNAVYVVLQMPADSGASDSDSTVVTLSATPGRYGLMLAAEPDLPSGSVLTFSYAIHFLQPTGVPGGSYPSVSLYANWLGLGRVQDDSTFRFLPHTRPGGDLIRATISEPGLYLLAAPVTPP